MGSPGPGRPDDGKSEGSGVVDQHSYLAKADAAFADEDYERALSYYSRALEYDINMEEAWLGQLRCLIEMRELQEAMVWAERALERFPSSGAILAARGVIENRLGRTSDAIGFSDAAFSCQLGSPYGWIARGEVLIPVNDRNAKACFLKAVEMAPNDWEVQAWIARACYVQGRYPLALEHYRNAVRLDPSRFTCFYWLGRCCEEIGDTQEAQRAYRGALSASPGYRKAREAMRALEDRSLLRRMADGFRGLFGRR